MIFNITSLRDKMEDPPVGQRIYKFFRYLYPINSKDMKYIDELNQAQKRQLIDIIKTESNKICNLIQKELDKN